MSASMAEVVSGFLEEFGDEYDLSDSRHIKLLAAHVDEQLAANGYGKLEEAWNQGNGTGQAWIKERGDARRLLKEDPPPPVNPYRRPE